MSDSPDAAVENEIVDTEFRAKILPDARAMLDQVKKKLTSGVTKGKIDEHFKIADKKDYFSFLLLRFLLLCEHALRNLQRGGETVQGILISKRIWIQLTNYDDPKAEPTAEFITSLEQSIATLRRDLKLDDDDIEQTTVGTKKNIEQLLKKPFKVD